MADLKDQILGLGAEEQRDLLTEVLGGLPVVRLNELVKHLEETWGVSAAVAAMRVAARKPRPSSTSSSRKLATAS